MLYQKFWQQTFNYHTFTTRAEFWLSLLINVLLWFGINALLVIGSVWPNTVTIALFDLWPVTSLLTMLVLVVPTFSCLIRRLRSSVLWGRPLAIIMIILVIIWLFWFIILPKLAPELVDSEELWIGTWLVLLLLTLVPDRKQNRKQSGN